jgi:hypothetical protein
MTPSHNEPRNARHTDTPWFAGWAHALIWVLLAVAALLLVGFTAVVSDITERGELRRLHQRSSGLLLQPDELAARGMDVARLVALTSEKLAPR